jgi:hypothetical protein
MTAIGYDLREVGAGLLSRAQAGIASLRRTTPAVLLLRLLVFGALLIAAAIVLPTDISLGGRAFLAVVPAAAAALFPRTRVVGLALLAIVGVWLIETIAYEGDTPSAGRVLTLAASLYVAHAAAAIAAVLPHDCAVAPATLGRWAMRTLLVTAVSVAIGVVGMALVGQLHAVQSSIGPIVGSLVAAGIAGLLAWLLRGR